jgi:hypothetical protein
MPVLEGVERGPSWYWTISTDPAEPASHGVEALAQMRTPDLRVGPIRREAYRGVGVAVYVRAGNTAAERIIIY